MELKKLEERIAELGSIITASPDWYIDCDLNFKEKCRAVEELGKLMEDNPKESLYRKGLDLLLGAARNRDHYVRQEAATNLGKFKYEGIDLINVTNTLLELLDKAWYETSEVANALANFDYSQNPELKQRVIRGMTELYILSDSWKSGAKISPAMKKMLTENPDYKKPMIEKIGEIYEKDPSSDTRAMFGYHTADNTINLLEILNPENLQSGEKELMKSTLRLIEKNSRYRPATDKAKEYLTKLG